MTRGRQRPKCCKHFLNVYFRGLLTWPVRDPALSHGRRRPGTRPAPGSSEQPENGMYLSSRMLCSCMSYPHQEWERVIGFKCQDVPSVEWKAHSSFLSYRFLFLFKSHVENCNHLLQKMTGEHSPGRGGKRHSPGDGRGLSTERRQQAAGAGEARMRREASVGGGQAERLGGSPGAAAAPCPAAVLWRRV